MLEEHTKLLGQSYRTFFFPYSNSGSQSITIWGPVSQGPVPTSQDKEDRVAHACGHQERRPEAKNHASFMRAADVPLRRKRISLPSEVVRDINIL